MFKIIFKINSNKIYSRTFFTYNQSIFNNKNNNKFLRNIYSLDPLKVNKRKYYKNSLNLTKFSTNTTPGVGPLTNDRAYELVLSLTEEERNSLKDAIQRYEAVRIKEGFEGQLAATRWRSRFGRPAKIPSLGEVDPTGSYCAVPYDLLRKKMAESSKPPSQADLSRLFLINAIPFVGFGFLDNFTMIIAGDYIENAFGMFMCISTMAAAGLGNTISDVLGISSAYYVERLSEMLGFRAPNLTPAQMDMKSSRRAGNWGRMLGITAGCLVGMFPLLFMDTQKKKKDDSKGEEKLNTAAA